MKTSKSLYSRLALITSVTLVVGYFVVYAVYENINSEEVASNAIITSTLMGKIKNNLDTLNTQVSNFGFSAGNVGIGTVSPDDKLDIENGNFRLTGTTGGWIQAVGQNLILNASSANDIQFAQNGGIVAGIYDGNVGIGTASPTYKLSLTQGVGVITSSATVNDYYLPVTTGGAKLGVPDNVVTPLFKSGYDTVFTLHIVAKEPGTNSLFSKTYAVSILYGSPLITQVQSNSFSTTITSLNIAYDNPTRTIRATIDTTGGQSTNVYWSINGIGALTEGKFEIQ